MLKNTNNDKLALLRVDSRYYLFYQVWKELTDKKTMDSYQYRMMNPLNALIELNSVIQKHLEHQYTSSHNVEDCKSETAQILSNDSVIKNHYLAVWQCLMKHLRQKTDTEQKLRALYYQTTYCYNVLYPNYLQYLIDEIENNINCKNNELVILQTNRLVSCCASNGWSRAALQGLISVLSNSADSPEQWELFKRRILLPDSDDYMIFIPVILKYKNQGIDRKLLTNKVKNEMSEWDVELSTKADLQKRGLLITEKLPTYPIMVLTVNAFDCFSACYKAIARCSDVLNALSFYNYIEAWDFQSSPCWVMSLETKNIVKLRENQLYETYNYLDSSEKVFVASKKILQNKLKTLDNKLQASYAYANLGKAAGSQEEKFINTWIALETLCRGNVYDNIISNVLETVPPALSTRHIYRHLRNFIEDCKRCKVTFEFSVDFISITDAQDQRENVKNIITILKDDCLYLELENKCKVNDLLLQRCREMHMLITDPKIMFERIKRHNTSVRMQLSRLYRIRNEIAHTGMSTTDSLVHYIENLEDYLNHFVSEVVMCAIINEKYIPEIIFEMIKDNYNAFVDFSNQNDAGAIASPLEGLLKTGVIELTYTSERKNE